MKIKKILSMIVIALCLVVITPNFLPMQISTVEAATKVKLNKTKDTIIKGQTLKLKISGTSKKVTWKTSNKKVATVTSNGKVKAKKKGKVTITAVVNGKKYKCKITVENPTISETKLILIKGQSQKIKISGTSQSVKWTTSNKKIATVSSKGKIKTKKKGTVTITATINGKKYKCKVKVETPSINKTKASLEVGKTTTLKMNSTSQTVKWSSSNTKIATVSSKGKVTAKKAGNATITAKIGTKKYKCTITVKASSTIKVTSISLNKSSTNTYVGDNTTLKATILPSNASNKKITWTTSDASVATVNGGVVSSVGAGSATITATSSDNSNIKATCSITVSQKTGSISGNITWQYNRYIGTKADTGAYIALVPKNSSSLKGIDHTNFSKLNLTNGIDGIYTVKADGYGQYNISNIPIGEYTAIVISKETTWYYRFENSDGWNSYMNNLFDYLSSSELSNIKLWIGYQKVYTESITVNANQTTTFSHDFGYTYI